MGSEVYVAGREDNDRGIGVGKYWKNRQAISLGSIDTQAYSIVVVKWQ